ncbi:MAG: phage portal protein [Clostridia bacterium]
MVENIIKNNLQRYFQRLGEFEKAKLYYRNKNDILREKSPANLGENTKNFDPFRSADNRISHNWFNILVNQKAGYLFSYPPTFDVKDSKINKKVVQILGDDFAKICKDLCIEASCFGVSYLHYWKETGLKFASIDPSQIIPIYSNGIKKELSAVLRVYDDEIFGENTTICEYWDKYMVYAYIYDGNLKPYKKFTDGKHFYSHEFAKVPFVEFRNNNLAESDLVSVKALIDVYDKIFSGFVNDIEDIQQVILVLTNYGGEDLQGFLSDLKRYKAIDMQKDSDDSSSGISTMSIDIPIEARCRLLEMTRKQIFVAGQGVDPQNSDFGITSGVALKHLYGLLDLKCGLLESEFKSGFSELIRVILRHLNIENITIIEQIFNRAYIQSETEKAEILAKLANFTSSYTLAKNNPLVEDFDVEIENLKGEKNERTT